MKEVAGHSLRLIKAARPGAASDAAGVTLLGDASRCARSSAKPASRTSTSAASGMLDIELAIEREHVEDEWTARSPRSAAGEIRIGGRVPRCAAISTRYLEHGHRDLPTVRAITVYRGLVDTPFGLGRALSASGTGTR